MNLINNNNVSFEMIQDENEIILESTSKPFIEANTIPVTLNHLQNDCIIPVFSKDNETTISHYQFINQTKRLISSILPNFNVSEPNIRVSHMIKGRVPSAIGRPAKELLEHEKTIYYERCAFVIEIPDVVANINGNKLALSVGGVRAYNQENLYSKKSAEKFKFFIGFKNKVCTNLCISSDGFTNDIKVYSVEQIDDAITKLISNYKKELHISNLEKLVDYSLSESQFAHFIGKLKMYQFLSKKDQGHLPNILLNDSQINTIVKDYFKCPNFGRNNDGSISFWNLYNLFTEANKTSYIDASLERNVSAHELIVAMGNSIVNNSKFWLLD